MRHFPLMDNCKSHGAGLCIECHVYSETKIGQLDCIDFVVVEQEPIMVYVLKGHIVATFAVLSFITDINYEGIQVVRLLKY